jgi:hypothetical protein
MGRSFSPKKMSGVSRPLHNAPGKKSKETIQHADKWTSDYQEVHMIRVFLAFTFVLCTFSLSGCTTGEYEASDEHCAIGYLAKKPASQEAYVLFQKCLTGYYSSYSEPVEAQ